MVSGTLMTGRQITAPPRQYARWVLFSLARSAPTSCDQPRVFVTKLYEICPGNGKGNAWWLHSSTL